MSRFDKSIANTKSLVLIHNKIVRWESEQHQKDKNVLPSGDETK